MTATGESAKGNTSTKNPIQKKDDDLAEALRQVVLSRNTAFNGSDDELASDEEDYFATNA